ncbi:hypothetical protein PVAR5_2552 [Paecilomyces variotii No. 5]|uniref:Uncharacterized protein n=1 Tax=Byssochlamys spectabilis (strain No. 5 / NBRC 109023) TaxID=1356009 RepID=V5FPR4_BYSSN|nr:hypothetical protein PVAR5_2552 [Paecilomyces variotii No. 5]
MAIQHWPALGRLFAKTVPASQRSDSRPERSLWRVEWGQQRSSDLPDEVHGLLEISNAPTNVEAASFCYRETSSKVVRTALSSATAEECTGKRPDAVSVSDTSRGPAFLARRDLSIAGGSGPSRVARSSVCTVWSQSPSSIEPADQEESYRGFPAHRLSPTADRTLANLNAPPQKQQQLV